MSRLFAFAYDRVYGFIEPRRVKKIRRALVRRGSGRLLELGVGTGFNIPHLRSDVRYVGIDPDREMLSYAARRGRKEKGFVPELVLGHAEELPFADHSFDSVISTFTLCSVTNPDKAVSEIRRVLKPQGRLYFLEHVLSSEARWEKWQLALAPAWARVAGGCRLDRQTLSTLDDRGFVISELHRDGGWILPLVWGTAVVKRGTLPGPS